MEISRIVYIRRVDQKFTLHKEGDKEHGIWKIGSSLKNNGPLRGLAYAEESRFLPSILGIAPTSEKWAQACKDYWNSISVTIPENDGLKLETGWQWNNEADYESEKDVSETLRVKGTPINIAEYILYRYCLVYGKVANKEEDIFKSPKIIFYLYTKEEQIKADKAKKNLKDKAMRIYLELLGDRIKIKHILRTDDLNLNLDELEPDEIDILLSKLLDTKPASLIKIAEDKDLTIRALINEGLRVGMLERLANSETISYGTVVLGNTMEQAIGNLNSNTDQFKLIRNKLESTLSSFIAKKVTKTT
jgi:hypothetical protein